MRLTSVDNGAEKQLVRDALGRVASVSYPYDGATRIVERYAYDRHGNLATVTDGAGEVRTTVFDQFDRAVEQHEPGTDKGIETTVTTYDENDNTVLVRTPRGTETEMHYDALDRMDWRENGANERTELGYDLAGNQVTELAPKGAALPTGHADRPKYTTTRAFDARNLVTSVTDGLGNQTTIGYDHNGNAIRVQEPAARSSAGGALEPRVTVMTYDGRDLPWARTRGTGANKRTTITEFDAYGQVRREINPAGVDDSGTRPVARWGDDANGQQAGASAQANHYATVRSYDSDGLLTDVDFPWGANLSVGGPDPGTTRYRQHVQRDGRGRVQWIDPAFPVGDDPAKRRTEYTYFDTDWVKTSKDPSVAAATDPYDQTLTYEYDPRGLQTKWISSKRARVVTREFWPNGRLKRRIADLLHHRGRHRAAPRVRVLLDAQRPDGEVRRSSARRRRHGAGDADGLRRRRAPHTRPRDLDGRERLDLPVRPERQHHPAPDGREDHRGPQPPGPGLRQ